MKILLVQPNSRTMRGIAPPPLGLMSIAPLVMREGFEVKLFDANYEYNFRDTLLKFKPDIVGVSTITGPMLSNALELSWLSRRMLGSNVTIVWGGIHASCMPEQALQDECVDIVVIGEGEHAFAELAQALAKKNNIQSLSSIQGLAFKINEKIIRTPEREHIRDLDSLPFPAWSLIDARRYLRYETPLLTSRGCPSACNFCYNQVFNKRAWRAMSAKRVIDYIGYLKTLAPIRRLKLYDDNATVDKERFLQIIAAIERVPLYFEIRPNITEDFVKLIPHYTKDPYALVGVESGSQRMLDYLNKGITIEQIVKSFQLFNKYKIQTSASFMIGLPEETKADVDLTLRFVSRLKPTRYTTCLFVPFPGSPLYNQIVARKLFDPPKTTQSWGRLASEENANINVSLVDSSYLERINRNMYIKSLLTFLRRGRAGALVMGIDNYLSYVKQKTVRRLHAQL